VIKAERLKGITKVQVSFGEVRLRRVEVLLQVESKNALDRHSVSQFDDYIYNAVDGCYEWLTD